MPSPSEHWDDVAPRWDAMLADPASFPNREETFRRFHWFLKRKMKVGNRTKSFRLLDLGCGTGEASWPLWKRVASVTFFDLSPAMLRLARNKWPKGVFVRGDAAQLPFLDAEFDVIVSRGALISQIDPALIPAYLAHIWRVLRPHGQFLFDFVCKPSQELPGVFANAWTRAEMLDLIRRHLPAAAVTAYDGTDRLMFNRIVLKK